MPPLRQYVVPLPQYQPVPRLAPPPFEPCSLSGGNAPMPLWLLGPAEEVMAGLPRGHLVDPLETTRFYFHPPLSVRGDRCPRGLTLAPHTAGLVVKDAVDWAARETPLRRGAVITWVDNVPGTDRPAMIRALAAIDHSSGDPSCWVSATAGGFVSVYEWGAYPAGRDVAI